MSERLSCKKSQANSCQSGSPTKISNEQIIRNIIISNNNNNLKLIFGESVVQESGLRFFVRDAPSSIVRDALVGLLPATGPDQVMNHSTISR